MEKLKKPILERKQMGLQFEGQERSGKDVVVMKEVSKRFAEHLLFNEANYMFVFKSVQLSLVVMVQERQRY